jgi:peroxiredoxin
MNTKLSILMLFLIVGGRLAAQDLPATATDISPLLIGERIPAISLPDVEGKTISLLELASQKQTILIFYRGGWCPYCNVHLGEIQTIEKDILSTGFQVVAISPDSPDSLRSSVDKHDLNYTLLSDRDTKASKAFGIAYAAPERHYEKLMTYSAQRNKGVLPVPSVFVLNKQGEIIFEYINPNYKTRISGSLLLAVLRELAE